MWCHLCKKMFSDQEVFSVHIMKKHRLFSKCDKNNSDSEHSIQGETNDLEIDENDRTGEDNSGKEDLCSVDNSSKSKSHINPVSPRKNTRVRAKKFKIKFTPRNNKRVKTHSQLSISKSNLTIVKSAKKQKKLNILIRKSKRLSSSNFPKNQPASHPVLSVSCLNELKPAKPSKSGFEFDSRNILSWLQKFKEMYRKFRLPLAPSLFNKIKTVHKEIFDNYCTTQSSNVTSAVLKVYEELDWLIDRHITSINESL